MTVTVYWDGRNTGLQVEPTVLTIAPERYRSDGSEYSNWVLSPDVDTDDETVTLTLTPSRAGDTTTLLGREVIG